MIDGREGNGRGIRNLETVRFEEAGKGANPFALLMIAAILWAVYRKFPSL
jgi:hypothetical protein